MQVKVLFFGSLTDITGCSSLDIADILDTEQLQQQLAAQYPALAKAKYGLAVNKRMITGNTQLQQQDTVALMPPFSGG
jgi:molybdopterin synthase sulfur carrier subunit